MKKLLNLVEVCLKNPLFYRDGLPSVNSLQISNGGWIFYEKQMIRDVPKYIYDFTYECKQSNDIWKQVREYVDKFVKDNYTTHEIGVPYGFQIRFENEPKVEIRTSTEQTESVQIIKFVEVEVPYFIFWKQKKQVKTTITLEKYIINYKLYCDKVEHSLTKEKFMELWDMYITNKEQFEEINFNNIIEERITKYSIRY